MYHISYSHCISDELVNPNSHMVTSYKIAPDCSIIAALGAVLLLVLPNCNLIVWMLNPCVCAIVWKSAYDFPNISGLTGPPWINTLLWEANRASLSYTLKPTWWVCLPILNIACVLIIHGHKVDEKGGGDWKWIPRFKSCIGAANMKKLCITWND